MDSGWPIPPLQFKVMHADPAWTFETYSAKGQGKSPQQHYDCMTMEELIQLKDDLNMDFIMDPNSICIMWATWPMLPQALQLMKAWGFKYVSGGSWEKQSKHGKLHMGTGYYFRSGSELFLLGKRGDPGLPKKAQRNCITAPIREHSRKPDQIYDMIEAMYDGPYLDLFSRQDRPGWLPWGNEAGKFNSPTTEPSP